MTSPSQPAAAAAQRSVLITGCSSGIGYAAAHDLRARGWRVMASCRREADCARLGEEGFASPLIDYQDEASIAAGFKEAMAASGGRLDALFNNGAFACPGPVEDLPTGALREIFEANFFGWHELTRRAARVMRAQAPGADGKRGRIVQCSSVLGFAALKYRGAYVATKFALEGLTDAMRLEMQGSGVEVILIEPGPIDTPFRRNSATAFRKWLMPEGAGAPEGSAHAAAYPEIEARVTAEEGPPNRFELPAAAVVKKLIHALESPRPRLRYFVTTPTYIASLARRVLPTRSLDRFLQNG
ncbi:MAG: SDR family NAD(P)-dependent oxidoreductase [Pseudomonadota bacterium]